MDSVSQRFSENLTLIAFFLPLLVGLVMKSGLASSWKTAIQLVATLIVTAIASAQGNGGIFTTDMLRDWVQASVITIASYYGVWSNLNVKQTNLASIAPSKGIGSSGDTLQGNLSLPYSDAA